MPANHCVPHTEEAREKIRASKTGKAATWKHRPTVVVNGETMYRCGTCHVFKVKSDFPPEKRTLLGIKGQCRTCHSKTAIASRNIETHLKNGVRAEAARRARSLGAKGHVSASDMRAISSAWGGICLKCGSTKVLQWDHVVPLAKGGAHCVSNLQQLCRSCNERKQARTADYRSPDQLSWVVNFKRIKP